MKKTKLTIYAVAIAFTFIGLISCNKRERDGSYQELNSNLIFPKGKKNTTNNFTGKVWLNNLVQADTANKTAVGSVTFEPEARTKWHIHPAGQIILALEGKGYYQEKGSLKVVVKKGDVIKCPANIPHWHGAASDTKFIQVAITGREKGETVWLESVTDKEYNEL
ncbi:cupin domain-containing protein [Flavobacterium sp. MC2016-06]|jgi:quercetin dioxygenase-like cupin family protein|uniref:cupin domain-containing protein n=1 Tax=Flavobacterium sp. MC2016-06 TaxID=2676308 RepID=UPI0012BB09AE|nr:cupin domain-containing protein [Flavobacterium sp. MC2016-06]MBU3857782.1 cupin domain-containing protein [Flavobacterium sp. MC2016-06]